ncbi:voltage-dependent T-type calcium channel subunit alpha-1G isoform X2 [Temnothorax curvispinosus]|uniref:Voltage-dependent T-type calcium channel subunit alpha-1G isoform X2 n=1 Tax=Temnothorax curvispinosus TaxID=300111 RepID=A0A6J1PSL8_9HYME|nr:voltage-dependent T-type calcium channel subunit alpha-1G isoform X2 [Temnothorax curvispinosus]
MSLHYPQGYRYRSTSRAVSGTGVGEQGSDSDVAELSDLEDDEDEDGARESVNKRAIGEEDEDEDDDGENDMDDEDDDDDDDDEDDDDEDEEEEGEGLPYPGFIPIVLRYLDQTTRPRNWCLALITNPWFERVSMMVILLNCITLGMYQPCVDDQCVTNRCKILQMFDDIIFAFFSLEMTIKMVAMGIYGKGTYLADSWNRLDFFIVVAGAFEYCLNVENMNLSAIRTIRVLRPLRAINRIPSMRILVMLLLDTLPMLGNVLLLCFFVFFIFGIVGVQLWEGILRQRCFLKALPNVKYPELLSDEYSVRSRIYDLEKYFEYGGQDYICSRPDDSGMHLCSNLPPLKLGNVVCNSTAVPNSNVTFINNDTCVNWNYYYTECKGQGNNPFQGTISFDNIGLAWVAIFLVISLEGWTDIMYYVQDAHSFWDWIYFVLLIVIGSFFMINLCLVVIATQFSETKKREMERMRLERARYHSTSTLASSTNTSEPATCYAEIVKYIGHLWRRGKRRLMKRYRLWVYKRQQKREQNLLKEPQSQVPRSNTAAVGPNRVPGDRRLHHGRCPRLLAALEYAEQQQQQQATSGNGGSVIDFATITSPTQSAVAIAAPVTVGNSVGGSGNLGSAPRASPEVSEAEASANMYHRLSVHRASSVSYNGSDNAVVGNVAETNSTLLSPPCTHYRRRSSVMFSDVVLLHGSNNVGNALQPGLTVTPGERNVCSSEKMTQTGDGNVWSSSLPDHAQMQAELGGNEAMTCQELLALSGALSAALPTGQLALDSFLNSLTKGITDRHITLEDRTQWLTSDVDNCSCCCELQGGDQWPDDGEKLQKSSRPRRFLRRAGSCCICTLRCMRRWIKKLVEHKYFQQGILLAILINTLSMGIEYHNQPEQLTVAVEISNIVFSAIFAVEMLLKVIAEGPFGYISNGFNVFDGIVVILSVVELCQSVIEGRGGLGGGSSGLSVLRTFRLLRILKLVRFLPNLRRQLFVMLRTMDNVAVFFSLLVLFIFIFSILGMNLFGCKFCETMKGSSDVECDRKNFDSLLWAIVTVFQILTQEDWNVVLFNGMQKTSHWAALYFVALMTFGNYVLFNLLVAILVEGFSSERNERREREQRELAKRLAAKEAGMGSEDGSSRVSGSHSISDSDTYTQDQKNSWQSAEELRKYKDNREKQNSVWKQRIDEPKCNIQKESKMMGVAGQPPIITHTAATPQDSPNTTLDVGYRDLNCRAVYPAAALSIESIDRSGSQCSIPSGLLKLPDVSNKIPTNNLIAGQFPRRISLVTAVVNPSTRDSSSSPPRVQRGYSWRLSRPSLRRKRWSQSDDEHTGHTTVLNNGRSTLVGSNLTFNGGYLHGSIRNDTQRDAPNNRTTVLTSNNRSLSPNNSLESHGPWSIRRYTVTPNQMRWIGELSRRNSLRGYENVHTSTRKTLPLDEMLAPSTPRTINNLSMETGPLPRIKRLHEQEEERPRTGGEQTPPSNGHGSASSIEKIKKIFMFFEPKGCLQERENYSLYLFPPNNRFRILCQWLVDQKWFDNVVLLFIGLNCITLAMERPNIPPNSRERVFLASANYIFTGVFAIEMFIKVVATSMLYGPDAYFTSGWNIMDGSLVIISIIDLLMSLLSASSPRIFGILRVFRLLRSLRPLRVINRAPGLKLVVQTLLSSLRPIGNIVLICCTFFVIFGILGVQLFKGAFYYCEGPDIKDVRNKTDCLADKRNVWLNRKYNFDDLGKALMSLFVLSSRDGWVNIMYTGLDAVGVDQQPIENYSEWRLLYFIAFILLVGFFVLNMFVGVVVENFHRCREEQEKEERVRRAAKRALQMEKKRRKMHEPPYYTSYSKSRLFVHNVVTSKYFDLAIAAVIGLNVVTMAMEFYMMPKALTYALKIFNYFFTAVFILESIMKLVALGVQLYLKDKWNQLDVGIVILSVVGIVLEEVESKIIPINPTIIRVMRVLRIARVLKLLKMAKGIRALLDTVMQALPQVGNLGLLFFLLFFIFAALGVELFGRLECNDDMPCQGLGEHAHFSNFGMAFLTLFRVATGDNWNGIMKDTLRDDCDDAADCVKNCCVSTIIAPIFFVIFVLMAQFVLVNVVVAVLMKHLEESHKQMEDELDMETQLERELAAEQEELLEEEDEDDLAMNGRIDGDEDDDDDDKERESMVVNEKIHVARPGLAKVRSLPANFIYNPPRERNIDDASISVSLDEKRRSSYYRSSSSRPSKFKSKRRQTFHSSHHQRRSLLPMHFEVAEVFEKPVSNLSVPRIISHRSYATTSQDSRVLRQKSPVTTSEPRENKSLLTVSKPPTSPSLIPSPGSSSTLSVPPKLTSDRYLMPTAEIYPSKATMRRRTSSDTQSPSQSDTSAGPGTSSSRTPSIANGYAGGKIRLEEPKIKTDERRRPTTTAPPEDLDVQSVINERRPSKLKTHDATGASTTTSIASDQYSAMMRGEGYSHIYVTTEDRSDEVPSPCGNASESTGTGSLSVAGSLSAVASLSVAVSAGAAGSISNGSVNDSGNGNGNGNGSGSRSGNGNGSGSGSGSGNGGGVHIGEGGAIGSDVRIYVDDTDSASSSNEQRRGGRLRDDETLDVSNSSTTTMRNGRGSGGTDESKETPERPSSTGGSLDPS